MSRVSTIWIDSGEPVPGLDRNPFPNLDMPFRYYGLIEVTHSTWGTAIRWDPLHAKRLSVENIVDRITAWTGPYTLIYYKQGWFKETLGSPAEAANRMLHVQSLDNVQILNTAFVKNFPINDQTLLPWLRDAHQDPGSVRDYCVEDIIDENEGTFRLGMVGDKSLFRQYVCTKQNDRTSVIPGNERWLDEIGPHYADVLQKWAPRLDHVVAALTSQEDEPMWRSWHRMVMPIKTSDGDFGVRSFVVKARADIVIV